jgi:hypothetical protein
LESVPEKFNALFEALMLEPDFAEATTMSVQAGSACIFLSHLGATERGSYGIVGKFLCLDPGSLRRHYKKDLQEPKPPHGPRILTDEAMAYIRGTVAENFAKKAPVSYRHRIKWLQRGWQSASFRIARRTPSAI